jgi:hypothetical protein
MTTPEIRTQLLEYTSTLVMVLGTCRPCDELTDVKENLNIESHYLRINFASIEAKGFALHKMNSFTGYP